MIQISSSPPTAILNALIVHGINNVHRGDRGPILLFLPVAHSHKTNNSNTSSCQPTVETRISWFYLNNGHNNGEIFPRNRSLTRSKLQLAQESWTPTSDYPSASLLLFSSGSESGPVPSNLVFFPTQRLSW
jgi:hypothetical protein